VAALKEPSGEKERLREKREGDLKKAVFTPRPPKSAKEAERTKMAKKNHNLENSATLGTFLLIGRSRQSRERGQRGRHGGGGGGAPYAM